MNAITTMFLKLILRRLLKEARSFKTARQLKAQSPGPQAGLPPGLEDWPQATQPSSRQGAEPGPAGAAVPLRGLEPAARQESPRAV